MKERLTYLETTKKKYPLSFNLNVMEEIQEQYGSISAWGDLVENLEGGEPKVKELKYGLMSMINEGIDIENENNGTNEPFLNSKQVGRIITEIGIVKIFEKIKEISVNSSSGEEETKNE